MGTPNKVDHANKVDPADTSWLSIQPSKKEEEKPKREVGAVVPISILEIHDIALDRCNTLFIVETRTEERVGILYKDRTRGGVYLNHGNPLVKIVELRKEEEEEEEAK